MTLTDSQHSARLRWPFSDQEESPMWFSVFDPVGYRAPDITRGWPAAPRHFDRRYGDSSFEASFELLETAHEVGCDSLTLAEHHYAPRQLTPDSVVMAAAASQRIPA